MSVLDIQDILKLLPHRYPFLLVDRVLDYVPNESIRVLKNITVNEPYFQGHFPGQPVMPGVLQLEAMAQAMGVLAFRCMDDAGTRQSQDGLFYFTGIDKAKFKRPVLPGDQLVIEINMTALNKRGFWKASGKATVDGEVASVAELTAFYQDVQQQD